MQASKTKKTMSRKLLAMILGVAMVFTMMPLTGAYAEDASAPPKIQIKGNVLKQEMTITSEDMQKIGTKTGGFWGVNKHGNLNPKNKQQTVEGVFIKDLIDYVGLKEGATVDRFVILPEGPNGSEYPGSWLLADPSPVAGKDVQDGQTLTSDKAMISFDQGDKSPRLFMGAFEGMRLADDPDESKKGPYNPDTIANTPYWISNVTSIEVIGVAPIDNTKVVLDKSSFTFNGKVQKPVIKTIDGMALKEGTDYTAAWPSSKDVGSYKVKITGKDKYSGTTEAEYNIVKAANPLKISGKTAKIKKAKVKKKAQKLTVTKVIKFKKKGQGKVTYTKASGNKKIKIAKTTGKVTVKKGLKKGTYKVKVKVKAAGNKNYKAVTRTVTFKIKVK